jgi:hypothetical protein
MAFSRRSMVASAGRATTVANSVFPDPGGPSARAGFCICAARYLAAAQLPNDCVFGRSTDRGRLNSSSGPAFAQSSSSVELAAETPDGSHRERRPSRLTASNISSDNFRHRTRSPSNSETETRGDRRDSPSRSGGTRTKLSLSSVFVSSIPRVSLRAILQSFVVSERGFSGSGPHRQRTQSRT